MKKLIALSLALMLILMTGCSIGNTGSKNGKDNGHEELMTSIKQMIEHVYSPQTIEEYNDEALLWVEKMQNGTHKEMFGQYPIKSLTEKDLDRIVIFEYLTYGKAEMQADEKECILVLYGISNMKSMQTYWIEAKFILDEDDNIVDLEITAK